MHIAQAVYPVISLVKRSSKPNVTVTFVQGSGMILRALEAIPAGAPVVMSDQCKTENSGSKDGEQDQMQAN